MTCSIDWSFLRSVEGFETKGYVPSNNSGVTVGCGFDIGQRDKLGLYAFNFSLPVLNKLLPYVSLKGDAAKVALKKHPLELTQSEAAELDAKVSQVYADYIEREYDAHSDFKFSFLDSAKQTVILSVGFQYGSLQKKCPSFFRCVTKGLWEEAVRELEDFGDDFETRRLKEATLLKSSLKKGTK